MQNKPFATRWHGAIHALRCIFVKTVCLWVNHRIVMVGKALQDHLIQPSTYHHNPRPSVAHLDAYTGWC